MSEADGALISHLDDLQARLSRVAALSAPVDVAVASARPSPARALKSRAAHSPRPTPVPHSPPASPALEGRAAYYQTRDVVPRRAKARHQLGGSETARGPPSPFATRHETTRDYGSALFHHRANAPPERASSERVFRLPQTSNEPRGVRVLSGEGLELQRERENAYDYDASFYVAELDATRAKLLDAESRFSVARRDAEVLAERLRLAGEAETACAARVAAIVEEAEFVAREATRGMARRSESLYAERESGERVVEEKRFFRKGDGAFASRAAAARVAAAEARGEAARLVSALGADPELADGLVRKLGEVSRLVADLAAAGEE
jgi:hypothetical protein